MWDRSSIREGMVVRSADGEKLGKVYTLGPDQFQIEKGFFFKEDYIASYDAIDQIQGDEIILRHGLADLRRAEAIGQERAPIEEERGGKAAAVVAKVKEAFRGTHRGEREMAKEGEVRMPLKEEELEVTTRERPAGEVRIHKTVEVEQQQVTVPVEKERVTVERVPTAEAAPRAGEAAFREETLDIPLREEEVEVTKRPVVREELRVRKDRIQEERRATGEVRKETVEVEKKEEEEKPSMEPPTGKPPTRY